jgi:hypothetical protein
MKNVKLKIENEGGDGKWGNEDSPMLAGCSARAAEGAGRDGEVQSPKSKVQSHVAGEAEFEFLRSNMNCRVEEHPEGWTPNGERNVQGPMPNVQSWGTETLSAFGYGWTVGVPYFHSKAVGDFGSPRPGGDTICEVDPSFVFTPLLFRGKAAGAIDGYGSAGLRHWLQFGGGWSLISTCFHLFPLASAVLIIKTFFCHRAALQTWWRIGCGSKDRLAS